MSQQQDTIQQLTNNSNQQLRPQSAKTPQSAQQSKSLRPETAKPTPNNKNIFSTTLIPKDANKDKTHPFFKDSKVQDCACVRIEGGVPKAVPFFAKPQKTYAESMTKLGIKESLSQQNIKLKQGIIQIISSCFCNQQKQTINQIQSKCSQEHFGISSVQNAQIEKISYKSSNQYGNHANVGFTTNPLVLAAKTKELQKQIQK